MKSMNNLQDFDYNLPKELIAKRPVSPRDRSRLLIYNKKNNQIKHDYFFNLVKYLDKNDVLIFNNSKVFPARLIFKKETGGKTEIFLLNKINKYNWECLIGGRIKEIKKLEIKKLRVEILKKLEHNKWQVKLNLAGKKLEEFLDKYGETPLPPYIKIKDSKIIRKKYQTIYARIRGSVAAPTAGLHFTKKLFNQLNKKCVQVEFVTLHVGFGTFQTLKNNNIQKNKLHQEFAVIDKATCDRLNKAKQQGKRIIAVGTTSVRVLEAATRNGKLNKLPARRSPAKQDEGGNNYINLFIYPGYKFKFVDAIITNFHLPKSSLLMLVSAFVNLKKIKQIYQLAIKNKYRFYSFGDAMFIK